VKRRAAYAALAALVGAGVVALLVYAAGRDTYYMGQDVSRWEHARGFSGWILFVASIGFGVMSFVGLLARAAGTAARLDGAVRALTLVALLSFPVAYVAVSTGH
jgi:hypothetical protein